jgi:hypothetical protein
VRSESQPLPIENGPKSSSPFLFQDSNWIAFSSILGKDRETKIMLRVETRRATTTGPGKKKPTEKLISHAVSKDERKINGRIQTVPSFRTKLFLCFSPFFF